MTASEAKPKFLKITLRIFAVIAGGVAVVVVIALWTVLSLYKVAKEPTALMRASRAGDIELVQRLLRQGADVNERRGYSIRVGIFLVHGPSEPLYGDSAVTAGVESGNVELVRTLLDYGADANIVDSWRQDIWRYAAHNLGDNSEDMFRLLMSHSVIGKDIANYAFAQAAGLGLESLMALLLERTNELGLDMAICNTARSARIELLKSLLQRVKKVPTNTLACAIDTGNPHRVKTVKVLLEKGVDPNEGDSNGLPALSLFVLGLGYVPGTETVLPQEREMLDVLLSYGADPRLRGASQWNAIEFARSRGYTGVAKLLEQAKPLPRIKRK